MSDEGTRPDDDLYDVPEAARLLGFSEEYVRRQVRAGRLKAVKFGYNAVRIRPSELEAFIASFEQS